MSVEEVIEYQKSLKFGESHFQDLRTKERASGKEQLHEQVTRERLNKQILSTMLPLIPFNNNMILPILAGQKFSLAQGHRSNERNTQKQREKQFGGFGVIY
jgi:hypothetical protein